MNKRYRRNSRLRYTKEVSLHENFLCTDTHLQGVIFTPADTRSGGVRWCNRAGKRLHSKSGGVVVV